MSECGAERDALARAWDEGYAAGTSHANADYLTQEPVNPYRVVPPGSAHPDEEDAAFYEEHYSDWTVHELPLMVSVPTEDADRDQALALVREILDEAAFDIRVRIIPPAGGYKRARRSTDAPGS